MTAAIFTACVKDEAARFVMVRLLLDSGQGALRLVMIRLAVAIQVTAVVILAIQVATAVVATVDGGDLEASASFKALAVAIRATVQAVTTN